MENRDNFLEMLKLMGRPEFDAAAFGKSPSYEGITENQECMRRFPDEASPEVAAYWLEKGLIKELHDTGELHTKWASYLPVGSGSSGRRYPLLFVMHGSNNPIYLAESYGYTHIAAREELIVIIPEDETAANMERLFQYARDNYPVDWSRVYMAGYSLGGYMTSRHALRWPERFAAVGVGGMLFANGRAGQQYQGGIWWPGEDITPAMVRHAAALRIPFCVCMGTQEVLGLLPVTEDEPENPWEEHLAGDGPASPRIDLSGKNKIASVNNIRLAAGCPAVSEETVRLAARESCDIVTEKLGFPFERTQVASYEGRSHFIGDCVSGDGESCARFVAIEKAPHWPTRALAEITWSFMRRFSRDPESGELIIYNR